MAVLIDNKTEDETLHPTLFGFPTKNGLASKTLNIVYIIVMVVAIAFAFHALSLILLDWNTGLIFLAALSVVGLPYCVKIIMYGREVFEYKHAVLCILISLLPTIFDFVGFYSETSIRESLLSKKFEVLEIVNYFDKDARESLNSQILNLEKNLNQKTTEQEQIFNLKIKEINERNNKIQTELEQKIVSQKKLLNDRINMAQQAIIDETQGVKGKNGSGVAGIGPKAKELESELRKEQASVELEKGELETNKQKEIEKNKLSAELEIKALEENKIKELEKIKKESDIKMQSLKEGVASIDALLGEKGLIFEVNKAKDFSELADVSIKLNSSINTISSKLGVKPNYVKFEYDNVIQQSFNALLKGEITALICFLLAVLLEIIDTIIVYMVRGVKPEKKKKYDFSERNVRERIYY